jgi:uncharacterized protein (TIGR02246 family)
MQAQSPEVCEELFALYLNAGDVDSLLALYEPQASHIRADGTVPHGNEAIRLVLDEFVAMEPKLDVTLKKVVRPGDDMAVLYDDWTLTAKGADGNPFNMSGKSVHIVRRQRDGAWRFAVTGVTNATW